MSPLNPRRVATTDTIHKRSKSTKTTTPSSASKCLKSITKKPNKEKPPLLQDEGKSNHEESSHSSYSKSF